jgi:hypothetical protein
MEEEEEEIETPTHKDLKEYSARLQEQYLKSD